MQLTVTYDLLGGYLIAQYLIQQSDHDMKGHLRKSVKGNGNQHCLAKIIKPLGTHFLTKIRMPGTVWAHKT